MRAGVEPARVMICLIQQQIQRLSAEGVGFQHTQEPVGFDTGGVCRPVGPVMCDELGHRVVGVPACRGLIAVASLEQAEDGVAAVHRHSGFARNQLLDELFRLLDRHASLRQLGEFLADRFRHLQDLALEGVTTGLGSLFHAGHVRHPKVRVNLATGHPVRALQALDIQAAALRRSAVPPVGGVDVGLHRIADLALAARDFDLVADLNERERSAALAEEPDPNDLPAHRFGERILPIDEVPRVRRFVVAADDAERLFSVAAVEELLARHDDSAVHAGDLVRQRLPVELCVLDGFVERRCGLDPLCLNDCCVHLLYYLLRINFSLLSFAPFALLQKLISMSKTHADFT